MPTLDTALKHCIQGRHAESEAILRSLDQGDPRVQFNLGWHEYRKGNWKRGAELQDAGRWIRVLGSPPLGAGTPIWNGEPLHGKTVLLRLEGGLGDEIIGVRWAKCVRDLGGLVIVSCHQGLRSVFSRVDGITAVISNQGARHVYHDYWIPAMSAHRWFPVEGKVPYISARDKFSLPSGDAHRLEWQHGSRKKIGIRWSGNPSFEHQQYRRFSSDWMLHLSLDISMRELFCFCSFQRDHDLQQLPSYIVDLADLLHTWEDTMSALASMDLVITSCTSIAHAAGALGIPTWVVVPILPYLTWAIPGQKTPWYDSVTVYRQEEYGCWEAPFERIQKDLEAV